MNRGWARRFWLESSEGDRRRRGPHGEEVEEVEPYPWVALVESEAAGGGGATGSRGRHRWRAGDDGAVVAGLGASGERGEACGHVNLGEGRA